METNINLTNRFTVLVRLATKDGYPTGYIVSTYLGEDPKPVEQLIDATEVLVALGGNEEAVEAGMSLALATELEISREVAERMGYTYISAAEYAGEMGRRMFAQQSNVLVEELEQFLASGES